MPTAFEMRQKNEKFAKDVRAGKQATHPSSRDKLAKRSPLGNIALGAIIFVVVGGLFFELVRLIFL